MRHLKETVADVLIGAGLAAVVMAGLSGQCHASTPDPVECVRLAHTFATEPSTMSIGQLDDLQLCVADAKAALVQANDSARLDRAIRHNFSTKDEEGDQE